MTNIQRFEDLTCWQKARELANMIYDLSGEGKFTSDYHLNRQIRSAAGSVMHNIAEGFDAGSDPEFVRFLRISRRSVSEVQSQLYLAHDRRYISEEHRNTAHLLATDVKRLINSLIGYLNKKM